MASRPRHVGGTREGDAGGYCEQGDALAPPLFALGQQDALVCAADSLAKRSHAVRLLLPVWPAVLSDGRRAQRQAKAARAAPGAASRAKSGSRAILARARCLASSASWKHSGILTPLQFSEVAVGPHHKRMWMTGG